MKFLTLTENLRTALAVAERSTGRSLQLPIVSYILLEAEKNKMKISATNLEQGVIASVLGKTEKEGKIAVPARMTVQFLNTIKEEKVELEIVSRSLKIKTAHYQASIQGLDAEDFPLIPKITAPVLFEAPSFVLRKELSSVAVAAASTDIRPELQGVFFRFDPQKALTFAATDSFRLAEATVPKSELGSPSTKNLALGSSCIVPARSIYEVVKIASEKNGSIKVGIDANQISFQWEDTEFISRLLEGEFPNYSAIIPSTFGTRCVMKRQQFIDVLKLAGLFTTKLDDVRLGIDVDNKHITVSSRDSAKGEYVGEVPAEISGDTLSVAFNYRFLVDGLEEMRGAEKVFFGLNQENTPAMLRPEGNDLYTYVVMPIRL